MNDIRLSPATLLMLVAVVGAGAFAAGRSMPSETAPPQESAPSRPTSGRASEEPDKSAPSDRPPAPHAGAGGDLPAGHPPVDPAAPGDLDPSGAPAPRIADTPGPQPTLKWRAPARWQLVPNASAMRIATYKIPRAAGDPADPELTVIRAGGSVEANADRWVGQFDAAAQKTAKRTTVKVGSLQVTLVEVKGTYSGGMMMQEATSSPDWTLLGAIVPTPEMPHFFKLTGPSKSVAAARAEFDAFVGSLEPRAP